MISKRGYFTSLSADRQSSIVRAALYAQTTTDTGGHCCSSSGENGAVAKTSDTAAWRALRPAVAVDQTEGPVVD
jgi:hypothetical protein